MSENGDYGGMTVNERLVVAGLMDAWDEAVSRRDREEMLRILQQVEVSEPQWTVDTLLANPSYYGFPD